MEEWGHARHRSSKRNNNSLSPIPPLVKRYYEEQGIPIPNKKYRQSCHQQTLKINNSNNKRHSKSKEKTPNYNGDFDVYKIIGKVKEKIDQIETKERLSSTSYVIPEKDEYHDPYDLLQAYTDKLFCKIKCMNENHKSRKSQYWSEVEEEKNESESQSAGVKFSYDEEDIATEYTVENDALLPKWKLSDDLESNYWYSSLISCYFKKFHKKFNIIYFQSNFMIDWDYKSLENWNFLKIPSAIFYSIKLGYIE